MKNNPLKLEIHDKTAIVTLDRPDVHNAVNAETMSAFEECLDEIELNPEIRIIILAGAGAKTFCAGGDLKYFATLNSREACLEMSHRMQAILDRLYVGKRVVIAAINGQALGGGCEILTACHLRIAASHATFSFRQAPNGIITGWGGGRRLMKLLGKSQALRLLLSGEKIDVNEALRIGLVDQIAKPEMLMTTVEALAENIIRNSLAAVEAFLELSQRFDENSPESLRQFETETFADLWMGENFREFLLRYIEKSS